MRIQSYILSFCVAVVLLACGGGNNAVSPTAPPVKLLSLVNFNGKVDIFPGEFANYQIFPIAGGYKVYDIRGLATPVVVANTARLRFANVTLALDTWGAAGQTYRLYRAAFSRNPDDDGLGFWIARADQGFSAEAIAASFINSAEFKELYGANASNTEIVKKLYQNVLRREGDAEGMAYWLSLLDSKKLTVAQVLVAFSESPENRAAVAADLYYGLPIYEAGVKYPTHARAGSNQDVKIGQFVPLDGSYSTAANDGALNYSWTIVSKPLNSKAALTSTTTIRPAFIPDLAGKYEINLVVSDGVAVSYPAKVVVTATSGPNPLDTGNINFVYLESGTGDFIGQGKNYLYTQGNAALNLTVNGAAIALSINGKETWQANFAPSNSFSKVLVGTYNKLTDYQTRDLTVGGLSWSGEGRVCSSLNGKYTVDKAVYDADGKLTDLDMTFEQTCVGNAQGTLRGKIHWTNKDTSAGDGPINPIPVDLWRPAADAVPSSGNYIYLESDAGDYIGLGSKYTYTDTNNFSISSTVGKLNIVVPNLSGALGWTGDFRPMVSVTSVVKGYYPNAQRAAFKSPVYPGIDWNGLGRGCNTISGWYVIDKVTYTAEVLTALDLRFTQYCEGGTAALRGVVHWVKP